VPEEKFLTPLGVAAVRREGADVTIVASSYMAWQAVNAAETLAARGIDAEVIDLRTIKPWDKDAVTGSVSKTGRLVVADGGWATGGVAAEIVAVATSRVLHRLKTPPVRVCLPDAPAPMSKRLESAYYPDARTIVAAAQMAMEEARPARNPAPSQEVPGQIVVC
jgi:pyruvate dehydrogenase E1 component beta subunit